MARITLKIEVTVEAETVADAVRQLQVEPALIFKAWAYVAGMPQGGVPRVPLDAHPWTDARRASMLGYRVLSSGSNGEAWYIEHEHQSGGRIFNDWYTSQEVAWGAAVRHAKRNWPSNWARLG